MNKRIKRKLINKISSKLLVDAYLRGEISGYNVAKSHRVLNKKVSVKETSRVFRQTMNLLNDLGIKISEIKYKGYVK